MGFTFLELTIVALQNYSSYKTPGAAIYAKSRHPGIQDRLQFFLKSALTFLTPGMTFVMQVWGPGLFCCYTPFKVGGCIED